MSGPQYGSPVFDNGVYSPPPSAKPTINLASPAPGMALPAHFTQMHPPLPNPHQQMTVYHHGMQVASPPQMNTTPASPYPTPSSQSSIDVNSLEYQEFLAYKRQQQQQQFSQPPPNMMAQPPQVFSYGRQQQDSGYGTSQFETLGQQHGLPRQQPIYGQGHTYGTVTATGNARVIRGNVRDPEFHPGTQNLPVKRHIYGKSDYSGDSMAIEGDVTSNAAKQLWGRD